MGGGQYSNQARGRAGCTRYPIEKDYRDSKGYLRGGGKNQKRGVNNCRGGAEGV